MKMFERRSMIKTLGAISLGAAVPTLTHGDILVKPPQIKNQSLETDILVVGGGTAGVIAAIQSGRLGRKTILVENGSQLGGTITTGGVAFPGLFHAWGKQIVGGIGWELVNEAVETNGDTLPNFSVPPSRHWHHQVPVNAALYILLAEEKCIEAGVQVRYYETPTNVIFKKDKWVVQTLGKGTKTEIICDQIIDCTGNAYAASLAGFNLLREAETQPGSILFALGGYNYNSLNLELIPDQYKTILRHNWLIRGGENPNGQQVTPYSLLVVPGADSSTSTSHTSANIQGRKFLLTLVRSLKALPGCEKIKILEVKTETAVRETYRIDGIYQITHSDYKSGKIFDDSLSYSFYPIDLWREGKPIYQEFLEKDIVATVPLRALIPKKSNNFIVAGRCVSSDRLANSALRVQASCMGMGQAAGVAAALASINKTTPLNVPINEIKKLIEEHGGIVPKKI